MDESEVIRTKLLIEEGLKMVVWVGRVSPPDVGEKLMAAKLSVETKPGKAEAEK